MAGPWEREYYQPEAGDAELSFLVFGNLVADMEVDASTYRTSGAPKGVEMELFTREAHGEWFESLFDGYAGAILAEDPELEKVAREASTVALLSGVVEDPETLDYLRDTVGVVTALLDAGGVALFDAVALRWWTPEEWREVIFEPAAPEPVEHTTLLASQEEDGFWLHSHGLAKFGRPDLSARGLLQDDLDTFAGFFESLIVMLAGGATIPDGQHLRIGGTKTELVATFIDEEDGPLYELSAEPRT